MTDTTTLLEAVRISLSHAARYDPGDVAAPAVVLWTDADGQWLALVEHLRGLMPQLLTLGDYDPTRRTGPTIWVRCVIEPKVRAERFPELSWPSDSVPVIYIPGVSRQTLRAVEECPDNLKPLVELQYRGTVWAQKNGKDWTVRAFLANEEEGLGLDVSEDRPTTQAMLGALKQLATTPIERLRGNPPKRLEAEDFDRLMIGDPPRDLLLWLNNSDGQRNQWDRGTWEAFRNRCKQEYYFDPETDGEIVGGEKLGARKPPWNAIWDRFSESPALYPGIPALLRKAKPENDLIFDSEPWPSINENLENQLRTALLEIGHINPLEARQHLEELEAEHGPRRAWVWAKLGMCPLANALEHLAVLARRTATAMGGDSSDAMAKLYVEGGYLADDAVLRALACVQTAEDIAAVHAALKSVYLPWLDDAAHRFQELLAGNPLPPANKQEHINVEAGECILFSDGLRFDTGRRLVTLAESRQLESSIGWRWAAFPTVTETAKPAISPVSDILRGGRLEVDFIPEIKDTGEKLNGNRFNKLLSAAGFELLGQTETGELQAALGRAWTEYGQIDKLGHALQSKLATQIEYQLELLLDRIQSLLNAGWKRVRVVTDHGWLLVPGGMPAITLPKYLTETRWPRCASIKESSHIDVPVSGWSWNSQERVAYGPGTHCFIAGQEYAHGGISLQECVVPVIIFSATSENAKVDIKVRQVQWIGLRCRVSIEPAVEGLLADLRTKPNVPASSIVTPRPFDDKGNASLLVEDDALEGSMVSLLIVDSSGHVIRKEATTVGGDK